MSNLYLRIKKLIAEINSECFDNTLNINFKVRISNSGSQAGAILYKKIISDQFIGYKVFELSISKNFDWTLSSLKDTIAHELIHVYECQILKTKPSHGRRFIEKMNLINLNKNYKITIKHSMESTKPKNNKQIPYILSEDKQKFVLLTNSLYKKINRSEVSKTFGTNFKSGYIGSNLVSNFSISRKLKYYYRLDNKRIIDLGL